MFSDQDGIVCAARAFKYSSIAVGCGRQEAATIFVPVTEVNDVVKEELRRQLSGGENQRASNNLSTAFRGQSLHRLRRANTEHIEVLKQRAKAWNEWRRSNRLETPDLSNADLNGMIFSERSAEERGVAERSYNLSSTLSVFRVKEYRRFSSVFIHCL
jgi:hypothetical protein